jgi:hypothetical protein
MILSISYPFSRTNANCPLTDSMPTVLDAQSYSNTESMIAACPEVGSTTT